MFSNKALVLASRPEHAPGPENFRLVSSELAEPADGEVIVRHHYLSIDPYMRGRLRAVPAAAAPPLRIDEIMIGATVGEVVASKNPDFAVGDKVGNFGGWQLYARSNGKDLQKITNTHLPIQAFLGPLGLPGLTAWCGVNAVLEPKAGETIVVSAATGAVGSIAGQLIKMAGAHVIGIASGETKCRFAVEALGYDACLDRLAPDFEARFAEALPDGIDGVFENAGGKPLDLCLQRLRDLARIVICGLVSSTYDGRPTPLADIKPLLDKRARMQGFVVPDYKDQWPRAINELASALENNELGWWESVAEGLEAAPAALAGVLEGKNLGKQLVKLI